MNAPFARHNERFESRHYKHKDERGAARKCPGFARKCWPAVSAANSARWTRDGDARGGQQIFPDAERNRRADHGCCGLGRFRKHFHSQDVRTSYMRTRRCNHRATSGSTARLVRSVTRKFCMLSLQNISESVRERNLAALIGALSKLVPEYQPSETLLARTSGFS